MICTFKATHYCLQMYLKVFATSVLKYMSLIQLTFFEHQVSMASMASKTGAELELLTDVDMLLMIEKGIKGGICHAIH